MAVDVGTVYICCCPDALPRPGMISRPGIIDLFVGIYTLCVLLGWAGLKLNWEAYLYDVIVVVILFV